MRAPPDNEEGALPGAPSKSQPNNLDTDDITLRDSEVQGSNRLPELAAQIKAAHAGVLEAAKTAAERAIECGKALIEAKKLVPHGKWRSWLKEHCHVSERSAQLYMKIVRLGFDSATVAVLGLQAAAKVFYEIRDPNYHPFAGRSEEEVRDWKLFVAFGIPWPHVEWLLQRPFQSVDEWLGAEGMKCRKIWNMREPSAEFLAEWIAFWREHENWTLDEVQQLADENETARWEYEQKVMAERAQQKVRRRRARAAP